nr:hypothetical protein [Bacillaceae bacterium]
METAPSSSQATIGFLSIGKHLYKKYTRFAAELDRRKRQSLRALPPSGKRDPVPGSAMQFFEKKSGFFPAGWPPVPPHPLIVRFEFARSGAQRNRPYDLFSQLGLPVTRHAP